MTSSEPKQWTKDEVDTFETANGPGPGEKVCAACDGYGAFDDRGFVYRGGPAFETTDCETCGGTGKVAQ